MLKNVPSSQQQIHDLRMVKRSISYSTGCQAYSFKQEKIVSLKISAIQLLNIEIHIKI